MKRQIVLAVSTGVFLLDRLWAQCLRLIGSHARGRCVVLMYHGVPADQRAAFARQMDVALRMARPVPPDYREELRAGERCFAVTFDDGLSSVAENALPVLEQRGVPAAVFVVTGKLGEVPAWATYSDRGAWSSFGRATESTLSVVQLHDVSRSLFIGSHTVTHPRLPEIGEVRAKEEIRESRRQLRALIGSDVTMLSFPYGADSERLIGWCREAGYTRVFTNKPRLAFAEPDEFVTGRVSVNPDDWVREFQLKLSGAYRWLPYAFAVKRIVRDALHPARERTRDRIAEAFESSRTDREVSSTSADAGVDKMRV